MAMLQGYFDESGTHGPAGATVISGFVGTIDEWDEIEVRWRNASEGQVVHYVDCKHRWKAYAEWEEPRSKAHLQNLSAVLGSSKLRSVVGSYEGQWSDALAHIPNLKERYPTSYSFCFENCIEALRIFTKRHWGATPIALTFALQHQYAPRAREVWDTFTYNGLWPEIVEFEHGEPKKLWQLQAADMIAHEMYQHATNAGPGAMSEWPLLSALANRHERRQSSGADVGGFYNLERLEDMMAQPQRAPLTPRPSSEVVQ